MKLKSIAFFVIFAFAFIGVVFSSYIVHEWVHWSDCHSKVISDEICVINIKDDWKGVNFFTSPFATYEANVLKGVSCPSNELKAYSVQSIIAILFLVSEFIVIVAWRKR